MNASVAFTNERRVSTGFVSASLTSTLDGQHATRVHSACEIERKSLSYDFRSFLGLYACKRIFPIRLSAVVVEPVLLALLRVVNTPLDIFFFFVFLPCRCRCCMRRRDARFLCGSWYLHTRSWRLCARASEREVENTKNKEMLAASTHATRESQRL
jgi:hypothetical protein